MHACQWMLMAFVVMAICPTFTAQDKDMKTSRPRGTLLRVTTIQLEPYIMPLYLHHNSSSTKVIYEGFIVDLVHALCEIIVCHFEINIAEGSWDGMLGEVKDGRADVAAAALYITEQRTKVVDFTVPFLDVAATLLLRRPPVGVDTPIKSVDDLLRQSEITYGTQRKSMITRAFKSTNNTLFRVLWRNIERFGPSALTKTNEDGITKVRNERFAFILPSTIGDYISHQHPCDLMTIDSFLYDKSYGFATAKNSSVIPKLNSALTELKRTGFVERIYRKWWYEKGNSCYKASAVLGVQHVSTASQSVWITLPLISSLLLAIS